MDAAKMIEGIQAHIPTLTLLDVKVQQLLKKIPDLDAFIAKAPGLDNYRFHLETAIKEAAHLLETKEELLLSEMQNTGSRAWSKLQDQIVSNLSGEFGERKRH